MRMKLKDNQKISKNKRLKMKKKRSFAWKTKKEKMRITRQRIAKLKT